MEKIKITLDDTALMKKFKPDVLEKLASLIDRQMISLNCSEIFFIETDMYWYATRFTSVEIASIVKRDWIVGVDEDKGCFLKTTNYFLDGFKE